MNKKMKVSFLIATGLIFLGLIIFTGVMSVLSWDFTKLSGVKYESNEYEIKEDFDGIKIDTDTADIIFLPSDDGCVRVECYEAEKEKHEVKVEGGTLSVKRQDTRKWYEHIGINFASPKIKIYLPSESYGDLKIDSSTGSVDIPKDFEFKNVDISLSTGGVTSSASANGEIKVKTTTGKIAIDDLSAQKIDLSVTTGKISASKVECAGSLSLRVSTGKTELSSVKCESLTTDGSTGDIKLDGVIASGKISIERSTGDVEFVDCDGGEIYAKTTTGDVFGTLLTDKIFYAKSNTGEVDVPKSTVGGICEITASTGDIKISVK